MSTTLLDYTIAYLCEERDRRDWEREFDPNDPKEVQTLTALAREAWEGGAR